ncbi:hypothetical protein QZH56_00505 [Streptomyces olivoreticuli]|uniref:hypothetical protein n=1 Tax=Streptomyces olivoreticuli TaxID=68246 RepID=UPI002659D92F|nr:hypothetical protein [Streptomyces olivoreticuli]WKK24210.1 hypothetical protein QZH56_00505 [Streptomyces olivoreticuli]
MAVTSMSGAYSGVWPVFPVRRLAPWPKAVFRVDGRPPSTVFAKGFEAYGTHYDIVRHLEDPSTVLSYTDGFVGVGADFWAACDVVLGWSRLPKQRDKTNQPPSPALGDLVFAEAGRLRSRIARDLASMTAEDAAKAGIRNLAVLRQQIADEGSMIADVRGSGSGGWYTAWVYAIEGSRYVVNCAEQVRDGFAGQPLCAPGQDRSRHATSRARVRATRSALWAVPCRVSTFALRSACRVRFAFGTDAVGHVAPAVEYAESRVETPPGAPSDRYDDPFGVNGYSGLLGYIVDKRDGCAGVPGDPGFLVPGGWRGKEEFWDASGGVRAPSYPFGTPDEVPSSAPDQVHSPVRVSRPDPGGVE